MSHHTSNSLKAYCCDRTISPAGGQISLQCLPSLSRSRYCSSRCSLSLSFSTYIYISLSLSIFLLLFPVASRCGSRADCRARYGGRRKIPLCEGRIIRSSVPTALRRSVAAAPPHPLPNHPPASPLPLPPTRTGALLPSSLSHREGNSPSSSSI